MVENENSFTFPDVAMLSHSEVNDVNAVSIDPGFIDTTSVANYTSSFDRLKDVNADGLSQGIPDRPMRK
jgi:hypothetical protein